MNALLIVAAAFQEGGPQPDDYARATSTNLALDKRGCRQTNRIALTGFHRPEPT
jgi:hypothetical protein